MNSEWHYHWGIYPDTLFLDDSKPIVLYFKRSKKMFLESMQRYFRRKSFGRDEHLVLKCNCETECCTVKKNELVYVTKMMLGNESFNMFTVTKEKLQ